MVHHTALVINNLMKMGQQILNFSKGNGYVGLNLN